MSGPPESGVASAGRTPTSRRGVHSDRRNRTRRALLSAARRLVARRGVDQTSVADIGEEAGYSRGLVNHRFGSKTALLRALAQDSVEALESIFLDTNPDKLESLVELVHCYLDWIGGSVEDARAFFAMWGAAVPEESVLQSVFAGFDAIFRRRIERIVITGQANGTVRSGVEPVGISIVVVAMLRGIGVQNVVAPENVDLEVARTACEQYVRLSLTPRAGT